MTFDWLNRQVLVLNMSYEPLLVVNARKAIVLLCLDKAEVVESNAHLVHSVSLAMPLPSVIRVLHYVHKPYREVVLNRRNVIRRDHHTCQYCGDRVGPMTVDHVIPKRLGGRDTWQNLVCACQRCNSRKGGHLLREVSLKLISQPHKPNQLYAIQHFGGTPEQAWQPYLYMN
ncbi:HNH endonuclease [bacterium]|nr:HNH endonuclease [bacterium]